MNIMIKRLYGLTQQLLLSFVIHSARLLKVHFIVGSQYAFFSVINCIAPLTGAFCNLLNIGIVFGLGILWHLFFNGGAHTLLHSILLVYHIPSLCAALYWRFKGAWFRVGLPILCICLFILHPHGAQAYMYTGYWLIPIILYYMPIQSIFGQALGSTFIAHAVGSVIWLYSLNLHPQIFYALLPIVIIERLIFATGMTAIYYLVYWIVHNVPHKLRVLSRKHSLSNTHQCEVL